MKNVQVEMTEKQAIIVAGLLGATKFEFELYKEISEKLSTESESLADEISLRIDSVELNQTIAYILQKEEDYKERVTLYASKLGERLSIYGETFHASDKRLFDTDLEFTVSKDSISFTERDNIFDCDVFVIHDLHNIEWL